MSKKILFSWSYMKSSLHIMECFSGKHLNLKLKIVRANLPFFDFNVCNNWKGSTYYFYVLIDDFFLRNQVRTEYFVYSFYQIYESSNAFANYCAR